MSKEGWIGVDLDGTLAEYAGWNKDRSIGMPIPSMVSRVRGWLQGGRDVRLFTARANEKENIPIIQAWLLEHIGEVIAITSTKDKSMIEIWDDVETHQCVKNQGSLGDYIALLGRLGRGFADHVIPKLTPISPPYYYLNLADVYAKYMIDDTRLMVAVFRCPDNSDGAIIKHVLETLYAEAGHEVLVVVE